MTAPTTTGLVVTTIDELKAIVREQVDEAISALLAQRRNEPSLLTCAKLCAKLGVSRASVFRWRREGMPALRAGDEFRYELDEVMAWLRGRSA